MALLKLYKTKGMNKNQLTALTVIILTVVSTGLTVYALFEGITRGRWDIATFFLLSAWILLPVEILKKKVK